MTCELERHVEIAVLCQGEVVAIFKVDTQTGECSLRTKEAFAFGDDVGSVVQSMARAAELATDCVIAAKSEGNDPE